MHRAILAAVALLCAGPAAAGERWSVYDGDTLYRWTDTRRTLTREPVRLVDVDTPELHSRCPAEFAAAVAARELVVHALAEATVITLERTGRTDKYYRTLGRVYVDGRSISELLLEAGLARPYHGEHRQSWCP